MQTPSPTTLPDEQWPVRPLIAFLFGILLLCGSILLTFLFQHFTRAQYLGLYFGITVSLGLIFASATSKSTFTYEAKGVRSSIYGAPALLVLLCWINPIAWIKGDNNSHTVTVSVCGPGGKHDLILSRVDTVVMDYHGQIEKSTINEQGQVYFQHIIDGDSAAFYMRSELYQVPKPDSMYIFSGEPIYLFVQLTGVDKIKGTIMSGDSVIKEVLVRMDTLTCYSDKNGNFILPIPKELQDKEYIVWFSKEGYKSRSDTVYAQTGQPIDIDLIKQ